MSVAFAPHRQRGKGDITPAGIQKLLDENNQLIQCIMDFQSKGKTAECSQYQQMLHRNLVYLATIADSNQNMQSLLPAPPTQNMPMGPGGMNQSGPPPQPPHAHNMPSEGMVSGGPPAPHMQNQMNGQMPGPNHMPMQGPGPGPNQPPSMQSGSMNMPPSSHGSMGGYNHTVPSSQGIPAQSQMNMTQGQSMGNYGPRPNMNMQPNQGPMMHQQPPSQQYNMPPGGGGQHYQGQQNPMGMMGQVNQGNHVMGQRPMPPYRPHSKDPLSSIRGRKTTMGTSTVMQDREHQKVMRSMASSRKRISKALRSSRDTRLSNSTQGSRATHHSSKATVLPKAVQASIQIILKGRGSSMGRTGPLSLALHRDNSSARTATIRASMETTSSERLLQQTF
ncbi:hypothetical protein WMY93_001327 [Mugilogobius chulae]|uniref:SS18 N-terminal domain-containing protein n=1 Tax=Mugilogobius chulae TaxID=88201 RepID=A0AAW0Q7T2_9GOBI